MLSPWISSTAAHPEASRKAAIQTNSAGLSKMNSCNNPEIGLGAGALCKSRKMSQTKRDLPKLQLSGHVALRPPFPALIPQIISVSAQVQPLFLIHKLILSASSGEK